MGKIFSHNCKNCWEKSTQIPPETLLQQYFHVALTAVAIVQQYGVNLITALCVFS